MLGTKVPRVLKAKARKGLAISPAAPPRLHHAQRKTMLSRTQQISEKTIKKTSRRQEPICLTAIDVECNAFSRAAAGVATNRSADRPAIQASRTGANTMTIPAKEISGAEGGDRVGQ